MRVTPLVGIQSSFQELSPDVIKAQRLAELNDVAEWRARRIQAYKDWSVPEKREAMQREAKAQMEAARREVEGTTVWLPPLGKLEDRITVKPIAKPEPKPSLLRRVWDALWN